jgi:hypothetical protein
LPTNDCDAVTCAVNRRSALRLSATIGRVETATSELVTAFPPAPTRAW